MGQEKTSVLPDRAKPRLPGLNGGNGHAARYQVSVARNGQNGKHMKPADEEDFRLLTIAVCRCSMYDEVKRVFDLVLATTLILVTLPAWLFIAIAIKLDSQGPVLIRQTRIGRNRRTGFRANGFMKERRNGNDFPGRPFAMYKFRTMRAETPLYIPKQGEEINQFVTRVGQFLRKTSLDELPQLINVLRGEMSIVGPRPEMPFIVQKYYKERERRRLLANPGITGLWQVYGSRKRFIHEDLQWDLDYLQRRSLWLDIRILFKTMKFILRMKNI